jgi:hypothetical protein
VQHMTSSRQQAACGMQHAARRHNASSFVQHENAARSLKRATCTMQQTTCSTRCTCVPHAADNVHRATRRAPMPHAAMHRSRGPNARRLRRAASPPAAAVRPNVVVDRTLAALLGRATSRACRHPGKPAGRRGQGHGVLWVLSAGGPRASGRRLSRV